MLSVGAVSNSNQTIKTGKQNIVAQRALLSEPIQDTVSFKGVGLFKKVSLINRLTKILIGGGGLAAISKFMESLSQEEAEFVDEYLTAQFGALEEKEQKSNTNLIEQGRADFKEMSQYDWINKYKQDPELFEKLLLEEDDCKGETAKRICFVQDLNIIRTFYKDKDALERIYSRENIIDMEAHSNSFNSPVEKLQIDCKDFIDKKVFEKDENGKIMLHVFADKYKSDDKLSSPFLHINNAYKKQLDKLADMYLTKDLEGKYPLEYLKNKPEEEQQSALKTVKEIFVNKPELYEKILETYDYNYLLKEKELNEKVMQLMKNGFKFIDDDGNKIIAAIDDIAVAEKLVNGSIQKPDKYNKYEKYNQKDQLVEEFNDNGFCSEKTQYFYNENDICVKKVKSIGSRYNSSTETLTLVNGEWKSDKGGGWKDW